MSETQHHTWCNYWTQPRLGCTFCDRMVREDKYPKEGETADQLLWRLFPDVAEDNKVPRD